jgi:hypothetical protein
MHWSQRYIGMTYRPGEFDCADFARLVNREVFGREIRIPENRNYNGKDGVARLKAMTAQIHECRDAYVERTEKPAEGDGVLIVSRGAAAHIGLYCLINGEPWVLHCASDALQAVLHRVRDLARTGYSIEGYYSWL